MKKNKINFFIYMLIIFITINFNGCTSYKTIQDSCYEYKYEDVKDILIRFHVIANSDSKEDQNVKLKVKDAVINYIYPYLKKSSSLEESRKILKENQQEILNIANNVITNSGFKYDAKIDFSREVFPDKNYGNIILPAGEYEAFQIVIGEGHGHNWWCVMFPPMCFIDVTKGKFEEEECKSELDAEIEKNNENSDSNENDNDDKNENIEIRFKLLEIFK